jgi:hypothetical protein
MIVRCGYSQGNNQMVHQPVVAYAYEPLTTPLWYSC